MIWYVGHCQLQYLIKDKLTFKSLHHFAVNVNFKDIRFSGQLIYLKGVNQFEKKDHSLLQYIMPRHCMWVWKKTVSLMVSDHDLGLKYSLVFFRKTTLLQSYLCLLEGGNLLLKSHIWLSTWHLPRKIKKKYFNYLCMYKTTKIYMI